MTEFRALLLTDVVDSTKLSEAIGDKAMAEVWTAHDRVARDLLPQWRGREIDKTDGMLLLFDSVGDAVQFALKYHQALASLALPLKARAGLHFGAVILRTNSAEDVARGAKPLEVDGLAKPTAARVMSLAHGGQTLLTPEAREALGETDLPIAVARPLEMKGVSEPVELFEVGEPDARFSPPTTATRCSAWSRPATGGCRCKEIPNNLPHQGTSFIGREREIDEVKDMLGPGAAGHAAGHGRAGQDAAVAAGGGRADAPVPGRRVVHRLVAAERRRAGGRRGSPGAGRGRGTGPAAAGHAGCALEEQARAADPGQLRAPDQALGRPGARDRQERAQRAHDRLQPRAAARAGREDLPDPAAAGAGPQRQPAGAAGHAGGAAVRASARRRTSRPSS